MTELNNSLTQMDWLQALNATSGNISPNPDGFVEDDKDISKVSKPKSEQGPTNAPLSNSSETVLNKIKDSDHETKEGMKEYISEDEEEEEYEEVDEEEEDIKLPMQNINPNAEMSLEEARYALQHIKNEASSSSTINEDNKKISKPPYSYASLIRLAILDAPTGKATLSEIYNWIRDKFQYYKSSGSGWKNSIRHNLSLNKAFKKVAREKDNPGKGCYWEIDPLHASKLDPKNFPSIKKKRAQPQLKIIHQQPKPKLNHALLVEHILRGHGGIDSSALNSNLCALNLGSSDQKPKVRYELVTGAQSTPEIILSRPMLDENTSVSNPHGQAVAMMSGFGPIQSQLLSTQIPTKQYISSQPASIPIILSETGNDTNIASYPVRVIPTSGGPGEMVKLEVTSSPGLSSTSNNVISQANLVALSSASNNSTHVQHIPAGLDIEKLRGLRLTDTVPASIAIQSLNSASAIDRRYHLTNPMTIGQIENNNIGGLNQTQTKMEVNYSHAQLKSPYVSIHDANNMVPAIGERSSEECIALPTITNAVPSTTTTLSSHHEINSGLPRLNVQFICNEKGIHNYNEIPKDANPAFKSLQHPPKLPLHPIPLVSCEELVQGSSDLSATVQATSIPISSQQNYSIPTSAISANSFANVSESSLISARTTCVSSTLTSTTAPLPHPTQLEPFSNSIGNTLANLQCVNPTEVHIEGYLSPTPIKSIDVSRNISPSVNETLSDFSSTSRELKKVTPQSIECSNVDFSSVNEELLSPANFSTYDPHPSSVSMNRIPHIERISSPKDVPVFSMPDPMIMTSSSKDHYDHSSPSPMQDTDEGPALLSPLKGVPTDQKLIDMGVEFHMMLQKQNYLKKPGNATLHHQDRLVPISTEATKERDMDVDDDDDEIEDNFNWDKLL